MVNPELRQGGEKCGVRSSDVPSPCWRSKFESVPMPLLGLPAYTQLPSALREVVARTLGRTPLFPQLHATGGARKRQPGKRFLILTIALASLVVIWCGKWFQRSRLRNEQWPVTKIDTL